LTAGSTLLLLGGEEWRPGTEPADRWWLARAARPAVTVVTSAAGDQAERAVTWARRYFAGLGAAVDACHILTGADAADPARLQELEGAAALYLCGGDPALARSVLVGSPAGARLGARFRAGVPVAGSSAGAMVLADPCLLPAAGFATRPGLGLLPATVVVPHWGRATEPWRLAVARLTARHPCLCLDERTGVGWDGDAWRVLGAGGAVVIGPRGATPVGSGAALPRPGTMAPMTSPDPVEERRHE